MNTGTARKCCDRGERIVCEGLFTGIYCVAKEGLEFSGHVQHLARTSHITHYLALK